jgi:hypothetical protein
MPSLRGQLTPREGAGPLPALLLEWGQLPCSSHSQALRRRDKGKPAVRRGRKAYGPALLKHRAGSRAIERRWGQATNAVQNLTPTQKGVGLLMMTRTTMHPLKILAAVGAAFLL